MTPRDPIPSIRLFLEELAELSDDAIDEGDPALIGSFRDGAKELVAWLDRVPRRDEPR